MDQLRGYKGSCRFSLGRLRFGSIKFKSPNSSQPFINSEQRKEMKEDQAEEEEAESIGFKEDDGAKSIDLEGEEEKKHVCSECGKRFKSGKALGGHKRIHVLEARKFSMVRPKMVVAGSRSETERDDFEVDCVVCHKKFTSMKALYGHMRFHPDRGWKGVLPPHHHHNPLGDDHDDFISSDYDDDDDDDYEDGEDDDENLELWDNHWEVENVVDLKDSIKEGWAATGKRGRRSALKDHIPPSQEDDIDAKDLLFLATTAEAVDLDAAEAREMMKKRRKKKKRLSEMKKESSSSSHDHHHQLEVAAAAEEGGGGAREKHVCVTCNKSFASYQALGGHRASHNKVKSLENHQARANTSEALLLGAEATVTGLASAQGPSTSLSISSNKGDHVCNICQKSFTTGQALGGHKRCHWPGPASNEAQTAPAPVSSEFATGASTSLVAGSSSQVAETVEEVKNLKRKFLEFDLNELPPNEE